MSINALGYTIVLMASPCTESSSAASAEADFFFFVRGLVAVSSVELCALSRLWISDILGVGADATTDRLSDAT